MDLTENLTKSTRRAMLGRVSVRRWVSAVLMVVVTASSLNAQTPQFRTQAPTPIQGGVGTGGPQVDIPQTNLTPIGPPAGIGAPTIAPAPADDPYAIAPNPGVFGAPPPAAPTQGPGFFDRMFSPGATPAQPAYGSPAPINVTPYSGQQGFGQPTMAPPPAGQPGFGTPAPQSGFGQPGAMQPGAVQPGFSTGGFGTDAVYGTTQPYGGTPAPLGATAFPDSIYPSSTPSTLFPNGVFASSPWVGGSEISAKAFRLFQGPRFRHAYIGAGDDLSDVAVNDTDMSAVFAFPRFLYSTQPLYVIPSFSLHLWDGPKGVIGADLPANAYSAFLDMGWESDPTRMVSTEFGIRVGVFTDFDTYNSRSVRVLGQGLVNFRLSPFSTIRGGVYYVDRFSTKLVPAFGLLYQPNPFTRWDLFFPQPKFEKYCRTVGRYDLWWYIAGDYGGGSWTIRRTSGMEDSMDMNELRLLFGLEWGQSAEIQKGRRTAFFEFGYAFKREIKYRLRPQDDFDTRDAIMVRAGFGY